MSMPVQKPGRSKQDYGTPPEFLAAVKDRLGITEFDIDLAASEHNTCAPLHYNEELDALKQNWAIGNGWNWLNPPFTHIEPWVKRAYEQSVKYGVKTAVLVPAGVGSNWWRDWVHRKATVLLLNGRLTFVGETTCYPKDCCLLLYSLPDMGVQYSVWSWRE